jgi:hypothetical protein
VHHFFYHDFDDIFWLFTAVISRRKSNAAFVGLTSGALGLVPVAIHVATSEVLPSPPLSRIVMQETAKQNSVNASELAIRNSDRYLPTHRANFLTWRSF